MACRCTWPQAVIAQWLAIVTARFIGGCITYCASSLALVGALARDLEGNAVWSVALDLEDGSGLVVEVLVEKLENIIGQLKLPPDTIRVVLLTSLEALPKSENAGIDILSGGDEEVLLN